MLKQMLIAGIGGFFGTCGRFAVNKLCTLFWLAPLPLATLIVNLGGCLLFGLFSGLAEKNNLITQTQSALLITGFCGGFTTFSTFSGELFNMGAKGQWSLSALYLFTSIVAGIAMVWLGRIICK